MLQSYGKQWSSVQHYHNAIIKILVRDVLHFENLKYVMVVKTVQSDNLTVSLVAAVKFAGFLTCVFSHQLSAVILTCSQMIPPDLCHPPAPMKCLFFPALKWKQATVSEEVQCAVTGHQWIWGNTTVPGYLPPRLLLMKQTTSRMRTMRATAHIIPMNQPWVEMSTWSWA